MTGAIVLVVVVVVAALSSVLLGVIAWAGGVPSIDPPNPARDVARRRAAEVRALERLERRIFWRATWRRFRPVAFGALGGGAAVALYWLGWVAR